MDDDCGSPFIAMTRSWRKSASRMVWDGARPNQFRELDFQAPVDFLMALNVATAVAGLSPLKCVGLSKFKGDRKNQWAMTVNDRWQICFDCKGDAYNGEITELFIKDASNASPGPSWPSPKA
jgi:proteic killer suppression protein